MSPSASRRARQSGAVTVQSGGELFVNGATISGGVQATNPAAISICDTRINGSLRCRMRRIRC